MSEFYNILMQWVKKDYEDILKICKTADEFDACRLDVLKLLENFPDAGIEATFTMYEITVTIYCRKFIIKKTPPRGRPD